MDCICRNSLPAHCRAFKHYCACRWIAHQCRAAWGHPCLCPDFCRSAYCWTFVERNAHQCLCLENAGHCAFQGKHLCTCEQAPAECRATADHLCSCHLGQQCHADFHNCVCAAGLLCRCTAEHDCVCHTGRVCKRAGRHRCACHHGSCRSGRHDCVCLFGMPCLFTEASHLHAAEYLFNSVVARSVLVADLQWNVFTRECSSIFGVFVPEIFYQLHE